MGSFNINCFASHQTIAPGDRCRVMPVMMRTEREPYSVSNGESEGAVAPIARMRCYPNAFWTPIWGCFEAEYFDYGGVHLIDSEVQRRRLLAFFAALVRREISVEAEYLHSINQQACLTEFLKAEAPDVAALVERMNVERPEGPTHNEKLAPAFDYSTRIEVASLQGAEVWEQLEAAWDYLWEEARESALYISNRDAAVPVQFAVIHEFAAENLMEVVEMDVVEEKGSSYSWTHREVFDRELKKARMLTQMRKRKRTKFDVEDASDHFRAWFEAKDILESVASFESVEYPDETEFRKLVAAYADKAITVEDLFAEVRPMMDMRYIMLGLESMDLRIMPLVTTGQDYGNEMGQRYAQFVASTCSKVATQRDAFRAEDEAYDEE